MWSRNHKMAWKLWKAIKLKSFLCTAYFSKKFSVCKAAVEKFLTPLHQRNAIPMNFLHLQFAFKEISKICWNKFGILFCTNCIVFHCFFANHFSMNKFCFPIQFSSNFLLSLFHFHCIIYLQSKASFLTFCWTNQIRCVIVTLEHFKHHL